MFVANVIEALEVLLYHRADMVFGWGSQIAMSNNFTDLPCGNRCLEGCTIKGKMIELQETLISPSGDQTLKLVQAYLVSYRNLCEEDSSKYSPDIALPALFDLAMSASYAQRTVSDDKWTYCQGRDIRGEGPSLFYSYLKTCPRCSVKLGNRPKTHSHKPQSDIIGAIASNVNSQILREVIRAIDPSVKLAQSSNRRGDIDIVIYTQSVIALGEIKSSPLALYPLEIRLSRELTEDVEGERHPKGDHTVATEDVENTEIFMYIPHKDERIPLGPRRNDDWPFPALIRYVNVQDNVAKIIEAWRELFEYYSKQPEGDNRRWITCGCGGEVDDSKNAPGLERTDDIKKGTYQILKFGTYFKEHCRRRLIRAVLISNLLPLHKYERYLAEIEDVLWTKEKYAAAVQGDFRAFRKDSVFNLFDALICLTRSIYQDDELRRITSLEAFKEKFCG